MTLDQLRIFVTVAELRHVTRAAERLNMTQSSVSGDAELGFIEGEVNVPSLTMSEVARDRLVLVVGRRHP